MIYSELVKSLAINNTKITTNGFYSENTKWVSPVFSSSQNLDIPNLHVVSWGTTSTKDGRLLLTTTSGNLLRLEVSSDVTLKGSPSNLTLTKNPDVFFPKNTKTIIGYPNPLTGSFPIATNTTAAYTVIVRSVSAPSISTFTATPTVSGKMEEVLPSTNPKVYKLISGNSFTLNWTVNNTTATTTCTLSQGATPLKTFDNTDTGTTNDWTLSGTTGSFAHTVSSLTANATYKVSCSHNGLGTTPDIPQNTIYINVIPAPTVDFISANGTYGETVIAANEPSITVDYGSTINMSWQGAGETCTGISTKLEGLGGPGQWSVNTPNGVGSFQATFSQQLEFFCTSAGTESRKKILVKVRPQIESFTADKTQVISDQNSVIFSWKVFNANECRIYQNGSTLIHTASMDISTPPSTGSFPYNISLASSFKFVCQNEYASIESSSIPITVHPRVSVESFKINNNTNTFNVDYATSLNFSWTATNADSCEVSCVDNGKTTCSTTLPPQNFTKVGNNYTYGPALDIKTPTTFKVLCRGSGDGIGGLSNQALSNNFSIGINPPSIEFVTDKTEIYEGESVNLEWKNSKNIDSCIKTSSPVNTTWDSENALPSGTTAITGLDPNQSNGVYSFNIIPMVLNTIINYKDVCQKG